MKLKSFLTVLSVVALAFGAYAADETPLAKEMSAVNKKYRALKRDIADPAKKDANLAIVADIKKGVQECAKLEPKKTSEQADKAAYLAKYKEEMGTLEKAVDQLGEQIKAGKTDEATASLKKLMEIKEKGHKDFGVDED